MSEIQSLSIYTGSQFFKPLAQYLGLSLDQINFLITQVLGLIFAVVFRKVLSHQRVSATVRHYFSLIIGTLFGYFFVGKEIYHLFFLTIASYIALVICNPQIVQKVVLFIAFSHLSYLHLMRLSNDSEEYILDVTGSMMIAVQKVTSLAFSLHDGSAQRSKSEQKLTAEQKRDSIAKRPTIVEYFSYLFYFPTLLSGPLIFYNDYNEFICGQNLAKLRINNQNLNQMPSLLWSVLRKLFGSILFAVLHYVFSPKFPINYLKEDTFLYETYFPTKIFYLLVITFVARFKYYHAFLLGEAICMTSGFGFSGFTSDGSPDWQMVSNIDILGFENALNIRIAFECWNKRTQIWLRKTAYERNKSYKLFWTYLLSSLWHGLYPGYYLTLFGFAFFTIASRTVRRYIRPLFQGKGRLLALIYDCITYISTRVIMAYMVIPFNLLEFWISFEVYKQFYFFGHILGLIAIVILPTLLRPKVKSKIIIKVHQD